MAILFHLLLALCFLLSPTTATKPVFFASVTSSPNPFTARASLLRYWSRKTPTSTSRPDFFVSKLSPLSALDSSTYSSLVSSSPDSLTPHLPAFCAAARLLCSRSPLPSLSAATHPSDSHFSSYTDTTNFTNYGSSRPGGQDSFKNYSAYVDSNSFRRYSRDSAGHDDSFASYSLSGNVDNDNFTSYASSATGGHGEFSNYESDSNVPDLGFTNYDADSNGRRQDFTTYADNTNSGSESFSGYGKHGNGVPVTFKSYANNSNVINSGFSSYGEGGNGATHGFTSYGFNGNVPENSFKSYSERGNSGKDTFSSYRDQANVGDDKFQSYAKGATGSAAGFTGYGDSFNPGSDNFKGYGEGATNPNISFKSYSSDLTNFKIYSKTGVQFKSYKNSSTIPTAKISITSNKNRWVEKGKFFRESQIKKGTIMPMPDIRDKMPARAFLPRSISAKIPFKANDVQRVFAIGRGTAMAKAVVNTVAECERAPSSGETKKCPVSAEDIIDFATSVLGVAAAVRSTANVRGSKGDVLIGKVRGLDGGKITKAVSCHQSLFPYLVYYCHSVPRVRVYEAEILAVDSKEKINRGVAICHVDTSDWSAGHGAFVALGSAPGKIEVCHWIFEGDMTWTVGE